MTERGQSKNLASESEKRWLGLFASATRFARVRDWCELPLRVRYAHRIRAPVAGDVAAHGAPCGRALQPGVLADPLWLGGESVV